LRHECLNAMEDRCRSRQILGVRRIFSRISPNCPKSFYATFPCKFSLTEDLKEKVFMCFLWFSRKGVKRWASILPGFSGILPGFSTNQNFWGCACAPAPSPPAPLLWRISPYRIWTCGTQSSSNDEDPLETPDVRGLKAAHLCPVITFPFICNTRLQTMARGPNAAREAISPGPLIHFIND